MALIIDITVIAELDSIFTVVCSGLFHDNHKRIIVRLCIYLLLAIGMKTSMFRSPTSVTLSVGCQSSQ